jgi:hypothetical protein
LARLLKTRCQRNGTVACQAVGLTPGSEPAYDRGMFGGKKRREREAQVEAAMHQQQQAGEAATPGNPQVHIRKADSKHESRIEAAIDAAIQQNPALAENPALANSVHEMLQAAREDPQGFKQRMRDLAAASGASAFQLTPEGLVPLSGQGFPGVTGAAVPGGSVDDPVSPGAVPPAPWDPGTFTQAAPPPAAAPQPPAVSSGNPLDQLDKAAKLHASGALTDAEFEAETRRILGG